MDSYPDSDDVLTQHIVASLFPAATMEQEGDNVPIFGNLTFATAANIQAPTSFEDTNAFNNSYQYLNDGGGRWTVNTGRRTTDYQNPYEWPSRSSTIGLNQNQLTGRVGEVLPIPTMNFSSNNYPQKAPKKEKLLNTRMTHVPWNTLDGTLNTPLKEDYSSGNMFAGNPNYSEEVDINFNKTYNLNKAGMPWNTLDGTIKTPLVTYQNPNTTTCQFNFGEQSILSNPENANNNISINQRNLKLNISSSVSDFWDESGVGINARLLLQHDEQQLNADKHQQTMSMQQVTACVEAQIPKSVVQSCLLPERPIGRPSVWKDEEENPNYFACQVQYQQASVQSMNTQYPPYNTQTTGRGFELDQQQPMQSVWGGNEQASASYSKPALNPIAWENTGQQPEQGEYFPLPLALPSREDNVKIPQNLYRNVATPQAPSRRRGSGRRQCIREEPPSPWAQPPPPYSQEPPRFLRGPPTPWENTPPSIPATRSSTRDRRDSLRPRRGTTPATWEVQPSTKPPPMSGRGRGSRGGSRGATRSTRQTESDTWRTNPVQRRTYTETPFPNRNEEANKLLRAQDSQHTTSHERQLRSSSKREPIQTAAVEGRAAAQSCRVQSKQTANENVMNPGVLTRSRRKRITTENINFKPEKSDSLQFWSPNNVFVDVEIPDVEPLPEFTSEDISEFMGNL